MTLALAWVAILLCLGGVARFAWWNFTAPWGEGGEFAGASLGIETALWALVWAVTSVLGLILALVARWRAPRAGIVRLAIGINALSLLVLLLGHSGQLHSGLGMGAEVQHRRLTTLMKDS